MRVVFVIEVELSGSPALGTFTKTVDIPAPPFVGLVVAFRNEDAVFYPDHRVSEIAWLETDPDAIYAFLETDALVSQPTLDEVLANSHLHNWKHVPEGIRT